MLILQNVTFSYLLNHSSDPATMMGQFALPGPWFAAYTIPPMALLWLTRSYTLVAIPFVGCLVVVIGTVAAAYFSDWPVTPSSHDVFKVLVCGGIGLPLLYVAGGVMSVTMPKPKGVNARR